MSTIWVEEAVVQECQLCFSEENVKSVCLGINKQTGYQRITLCDKCRALLAVKVLKSVE